MHVVVVQTFGFCPPHLAAELELIEHHVAQGDHVTVLACTGDLLACDENIDHDPVLCMRCRRLRAQGLDLLPAKARVLPWPPLSVEERRELAALPAAFDNTEALRAFTVDGFDVGVAVLSTMISRYRNPHPDTRMDHDLVRRLLVSGVAMFRRMQAWLNRHPVDQVYVFNGRYAVMRAVLRACQSRGVACATHDRGGPATNYQIFPNVLPHDRAMTQKTIEDTWNAVPAAERTAVAESFYSGQQQGTLAHSLSFVGAQRENQLPDGWEAGKDNVVVFTSSQDEFEAIGKDWRNPIYGDQLVALQRIIDAVSTQRPENFHLYVRMHPNQGGLCDRVTTGIRNLQAPFVTVIPPESTCSSYALVEAAARVVTFGSTMGIEAAYRGRPSILLGRAQYEHFTDSVYRPGSHEEAVDLILRDLPPKTGEGVLKFGVYRARFGIPYRNYTASGPFEGSYRDVPLRIENVPACAFRAVKRWPRLHALWRRIAMAWAWHRVGGRS